MSNVPPLEKGLREVEEIRLPAFVYGQLLQHLERRPYMEVKDIMGTLTGTAKPVFKDGLDARGEPYPPTNLDAPAAPASPEESAVGSPADDDAEKDT